MKLALLLFYCLYVVNCQIGRDFFKVQTHRFGSAPEKKLTQPEPKRAQPKFQEKSRGPIVEQFLRKPSPQRSRPLSEPSLPSAQSTGRDSKVDVRNGGTDLHFSWNHVGRNRKWTWSGARSYCSGLGSGWAPISIASSPRSNFINGVLNQDNIDYIWTGGQKRGNSWSWMSGAPFQNINWSQTGGLRKPQPDNREGGENCLAILNNIYRGEGIKWHDIECGHLKPVICEKS